MVEVDGLSFRSKSDADAYVVAKDFWETVRKSPPSDRRDHLLRDTERAMATAVECATRR